MPADSCWRVDQWVHVPLPGLLFHPDIRGVRIAVPVASHFFIEEGTGLLMSQEWVVASLSMHWAEVGQWGSFQLLFLQEYCERAVMLRRKVLEFIKVGIQHSSLGQFCRCVAVLL